MLTVAAALYTRPWVKVGGYSCEMTEEAGQASVECMEGKDPLLTSVKNFPCPPTGNGLCRAKTTFSVSLTTTLFAKASPASKPVSRCLALPCQLPHAHIAAGKAVRPATPALEMVLLRLIAAAFARPPSLLLLG